MVTRRKLLAGAGAAAGLAALGGVVRWRSAWGGSDRPPSVVLVVADDMRFDYGSLLTTCRDGEWVNCTGAAAQTPLCAPSRATLLTGSHAWRTGVVGNASAAATLDLEHDTVATRLSERDYRIGLVGKYQNQYPFDRGPDHVPPGWSDWAAAGSTAWEPEGRHETDHCFAWAARFVASVPADQPFLLWVAPQLPHDPYRPPARYEQAAVEVPPEPPSVDEADVSTKPAFVQAKPRLTAAQLARLREVRRLQAVDVLAIDDGLRQLIGVLRASGRWDSTVVMVTSDNALTLGEHRLFNKGFPYEESVHVPFFVRVPDVPGRVEDGPISLVDVPATICALAGTSAPGDDGIDLGPLLHDGQLVREGVYLTPPDDRFWEGVRTTRYKYVEYQRGFRELYDLSTDPYELTNLAGRRDRAGVRGQMADLLQRLRS